MAFLKEYAPFFVTNPVAMLSTLAVGAVGGFWLASQLAKSKLDAKDERITGFEDKLNASRSTIDDLKERISDLQKRLGIEPNAPHKYAAMTGRELQQCARNVANDIRQLVSTYNADHRGITMQRMGDFRSLPDAEKQAQWQRITNQSIHLSMQLNDTYVRRFQGDVAALYQELTRRGASVASSPDQHNFVESLLVNPVNPFGMESIAQALDSMAITLPT